MRLSAAFDTGTSESPRPRQHDTPGDHAVPDLWAGVVDFVGIADLETFREHTGTWRRGHREAEYGSLENSELLAEISPVHDIDRIACPLFV